LVPFRELILPTRRYPGKSHRRRPQSVGRQFSHYGSYRGYLRMFEERRGDMKTKYHHPTRFVIFFFVSLLVASLACEAAPPPLPPVPRSTVIYSLKIDPTVPTTLYAGTQNGLFKSVDGGKTWMAASTGMSSVEVHSLAIDLSTPSILYAGTSGGVFKSMDGGWKWIISGGTNIGIIHTLAIDPSTTTPSMLEQITEY